MLDRHRPRSGFTAGTDAPIPGAYHGYDRFGRIRTQMWHTPGAGGVFNDAQRPALVELAYSYDKDHNVIARHDVRAGRAVDALTPGDSFAYDGLDRLVGRLGAVAESWSLDALGNWLGHARGSINETRFFNKANELESRTFPGDPEPVAPALMHGYDSAGNRVRRDAEAASGGVDNWLYTYDAWNRLVRASFAPGGDVPNAVVRAAYTYNGLHQRASRRAAANTTIGLATNDLGNLYYYDSAWRLCEERAATQWDGSAAFAAAKITQRVWCPLYIDALIATQTDTTGADPGPGADGDFTDASSLDTLYAVCDRKYDVIAMTDSGGILKERTDYSPYGVARHRPPADLNGDGEIDGVDQLILFNAWGAPFGSAAYNPDADINSDGAVNGTDFLILSNNFGAAPAPAGAISKHGNTVGYSGYIHDEAIGLSLARFRWFDAETGRWATRDPKFYVEGSSLYEYIRSAPINSTDPHGLFDPGSARPYRPNPFYPDNNTCNAPLKDLLDQIRDNYNNAFTPNERAAISCGAGFLKCLGIDVALGGISALALFGDCARMGRINTDAMLNCFLRRGKFLVFRIGPLGATSCVKDLTFCLDNTFDFLPARDRILDNVPPPFEHPFPGRGLP